MSDPECRSKKAVGKHVGLRGDVSVQRVGRIYMNDRLLSGSAGCEIRIRRYLYLMLAPECFEVS